MTGRSRTTVGAVAALVFSALFFVAGAVITQVFVRSIWRGLATRSWMATPAEILDSQVVRPLPGRPIDAVNIRFRYHFQGRELTSETPTHDSSRIDEPFRVVQRYRPGAQVTCFVDPAHPEAAVLWHAPWALALVILFPLLFVAGGGAGMWWWWRAGSPDAAPPAPSNGEPPRFLWIVMLVMVVGGGAAVYLVSLGPALRWRAAARWPRVPAEVISSQVITEGSDTYRATRNDATYRPEIVYRYTVGGRQYLSSCYSFSSVSTSDREAKDEIVGRLSPGSKTSCYVNPNDPLDAVIDRHLPGVVWVGLFPLLLLVAGVLWFAWPRGRRRTGSSGRSPG